MNYKNFYQNTIQQPIDFWKKQSELIYWHKPFKEVLDYTNPPFTKWFKDGLTNTCFNAVDRHLEARGDQIALIFVSTETDQEKTFTYNELYLEVNRMSAIFKSNGVNKGDRVLIYMPMVPQIVFAMLACARIGAIHSVVFGGFASQSLATRINDAAPKLIVAADAGMRAGKVIPYQSTLNEAMNIATHKVAKVIMVQRGLAPVNLLAGRDLDYSSEYQKHLDAIVPVEWVESTHPSYILYTSGTTGKPKGVQRDTGGHAVALAATMKYIFNASAGETMFTAADIGWAVGHSYTVYAPLITGMSTIVYEGIPLRPDPGIWWRLVERYRVSVMFTAPTAIRVLKKEDPKYLSLYDLSSLRLLFLAGEPLDEPTATWISQGINTPVIDNYWQTETGWPILALQNGIEKLPQKLGSPGLPVYGFNIKLIDENTGEELGADKKGVLMIEGPTPPGFMQTVWGEDARFVSTYWKTVPNKLFYSTFDWGIKDKDGYFYILGRTDDVINVAGHRLGTREIEECISSHSNVAEVAVVGIADPLKGQVPIGFAVSKDGTKSAEFEKELFKVVDAKLGSLARPTKIHLVNALPKTRSGKIVRRALQALAEGKTLGDISTLEDTAILEQIKLIVYN
jgi:propionyl-CoA synthetase